MPPHGRSRAGTDCYAHLARGAAWGARRAVPRGGGIGYNRGMIDTFRFRPGAALAAALILGAAAPRPAAPAAVPEAAAAASRLFMQSCVRFAARPDALRSWAAGKALTPIVGKPAETYLFGLPGAVYRATTHAGDLMLVSQDSGSCSVIAENTPGPALLDQVNAALTAAGISYTVTQDGPDARAKDLHDRAYEAHQGTRRWLMLVSTAADPAGGEAILTSNP